MKQGYHQFRVQDVDTDKTAFYHPTWAVQVRQDAVRIVQRRLKFPKGDGFDSRWSQPQRVHGFS